MKTQCCKILGLIIFASASVYTGCTESYSIVESRLFIEKQLSNQYQPESFESYKAESKQNNDVSFKDPEGNISLRQVLALSLLRNLELKSFSYKIKAAEASYLQSGLYYNPDLSVNSENLTGTGTKKGFEDTETTIALSQLIDISGVRKLTQNVEKINIQYVSMDYKIQRLDVSVAVTKEFLNILFLQEKLKLAEKQINISKAIKESVTKRVRAGKDNKLDLLKAKTRYQRAIIEKTKVVKEIQESKIRLVSFWAGGTPKFANALGDLRNLPDIPKLQDMKELIDNNPTVEQWAVEIQKRTAEQKLEAARANPDIVVTGGIKHYAANNDVGMVVGLAIPLKVFDRNQGRRLQAIYNLRNARQKKQALRNEVWTQIQQYHNQLTLSLEAATRLKNNVLKNAADILEAAQIAYSQGKIGYLEMLDAQMNYFTSEQEYIDTIASYHINKAELERLIGRGLSVSNTK